MGVLQLNLGNITDTSGNISLAGLTKIIANDGILSVQDNKTGAIALGNVDTATNNKVLNVSIDADFSAGAEGTADVISATISGTNGIHISDISFKNVLPAATEMKAQIATGGAMSTLDIEGTTI